MADAQTNPTPPFQDIDGAQEQIAGNGPGAAPANVWAIAGLTLTLLVLTGLLLTGLYDSWCTLDCSEPLATVKTNQNAGTAPTTTPPAGTSTAPSTPAPAPAIKDIDPESGPIHGGTQVVITGTALTSGVKVKIGDSPETPTRFEGAALTATVPPGPKDGGRVTVKVTLDNGKEIPWLDGGKNVYTYIGNEPRPVTVIGVSPSSGPTTGRTMVTISGSGFVGRPVVKFGDALATDVEVDRTRSSLTATLPPHAPGPVSVAVTNADGQSATLVAAAGVYTYTCSRRYDARLFLMVILAGALGATLHSLRSLYWYVGNRKLIKSWMLMYFLLPVTGGLLGGIYYLAIRAGFFTPKGTGDYPVIAFGLLVGLFSRQSIDKLQQIIEALLARPAQGADAVQAPAGAGLQVTALTPDIGPLVGNDRVTLTGTGFTSGLKVRFGDVAAPGVQVDSPTSAVAITPQHQAGDVDVVVETESGAVKLATGYTFTGVSPAQGKAKGGETVTIAGPGFAGVTGVRLGAAEATEVAVGSLPTTLTAKTPAHAAGKVDVTVLQGSTPVLVFKNGYEYLG
ncbi:MAG TPA: IPT/TIG domain-containing protein [Thermoanaerobaculia bacterium]|nr:IPT/TIG domain-containing protein [Thermoanaerobaculia bacterium]